MARASVLVVDDEHPVRWSLGERLERECCEIMTAFSSGKGAVAAVRGGAFHYVARPFDLDEVALVVQQALRGQALELELSPERVRVRARCPRVPRRSAWTFAIGRSTWRRELERESETA